MSDLLQRIDTAVGVLRAAGCVRAGAGWLTRDGIALPGDPLEAVKVMRRATIAEAVRSVAERGGRFTR
jgi:hypothetical protein